MKLPATAPTRRTSALSALLGAPVAIEPDGTARDRTADAGRLLDLPLDQVTRNEAQPRTIFDTEAIAALAASIEARGVIQPIAVRPLGQERWELIAGERRWLAAQRAGLRTIPAVVHDVDERDSLVLALVENVVRQDLNPLETARAYQALVDEHDVTIADLARAMGKSRPAVSNTLRLLELPDDVLDAIRNQRLTEGHGRALLGLPDRAAQRRLARHAIDRSLSVRALEALVRSEATGSTRPPLTRTWGGHLGPELQQAFDAICDALPGGVRGRIKVGQKDARLELQCTDQAVLVRLLAALGEGLAASA